jgi:hypothetical protein
MRRPKYAGQLLLLAAALTLWGCDDDNPVTPTQPPVTVTDTFSGTLNQNGATTYTFSTQGIGQVTATVTRIEPDSTLVIGVSLGLLNGTNCSLSVTNDAATQGSIVSGAVTAPATLCVRVYDVGNVVTPITYSVEVSHP